MTANLDIIVDERKDSLSVPQRAIVERDGRELVYVRTGRKIRERAVETGIRSASRVLVRKGLREGDIVCVLERNR